MKLKFESTRTHLLVALSMLLGAACSGDSNTSTDPIIDTGSGANVVTSITSSTTQPDQTATDNLGVAGEGMPYLYQTGYHVDTITITLAGGTPRVIQFVTDTVNNVVQEAGGASNFDDFWYDEQGRVSSFSSLGVSVSYNSDDTIKSTAYRTADNSSTHVDEYTYANGQLQTTGARLVSGDLDNILGGAVYNYTATGTLANSRTLTSETRDRSELGYDFIMNTDGLLSSAQKVPVGDFDIQFTPEYLFFTVDYDENKNIVKLENFTNEGELIKTVDFNYLPNTEPTPNIAGFMLITERHYREVFETY